MQRTSYKLNNPKHKNPNKFLSKKLNKWGFNINIHTFAKITMETEGRYR